MIPYRHDIIVIIVSHIHHKQFKIKDLRQGMGLSRPSSIIIIIIIVIILIIIQHHSML